MTKNISNAVQNHVDTVISIANDAHTCDNTEIAVHAEVLADIAHRAYLIEHTHPSRLAPEVKTAKLAKFESMARDEWRAARDKLIGERPSGPAKKKK
jgi:hypothetical protein